MRTLPILDERAAAVRRRWLPELRAMLVSEQSCDRSSADPRGDLEAVATRAHVAMDREAARALSRSPALTPACAAGCSSCCHVHADASVPEILAAAAWIRGALGREALSLLRDRLAAQVSLVMNLDDAARWGQRIPCALLADDGRCSIYEARPLRCRAFHSCSVDRCREAFAGTSDEEAVPSPSLARASAAVEQAYDEALAEAGLSPEGYRLEIGLLIALDDAAAGERWRAGEDTFARARPRDPSGA